MTYRVIKERDRVYIKGNIQEIKELEGFLSSNRIKFSKAKDTIIRNPPSSEMIAFLSLVGTWLNVGIAAASFLYQILSPKGPGKELKSQLGKALRKRVKRSK